MRILVVQTAFIGDVVLTTPLFAELRRAHPTGRLTVLTTEAGARLLSGLGTVDEVWGLNKSWGPRGLGSYARVLRRSLRSRFDVAIAAHRSVRSGVLLTVSRASLRVGFAGAPGSWAYQRAIPWRAEAHAVRRYLDLAAAAGGAPESADAQPHLPVDARARDRVRALLRANGVSHAVEIVCIAPGAARETKRWTAEGFGQLAAAVAATGRVPVIVGSADERELCQRVAALSRVDPLVLAGRLSIPEWLALLAEAHVVVGNDSGTGHVAAALGTPVLSIFGPTIPGFGQTAYGGSTRVVEHPDLDCRPCSRHGSRVCPREHFRCMRELPARDVLLALERLCP